MLVWICKMNFCEYTDFQKHMYVRTRKRKIQIIVDTIPRETTNIFVVTGSV
jgi:hypothetical protein